MKRVYELFLPVPPTRGNARGHWSRGYNRMKKYFSDCDAMMHDIGLYPFRDQPMQCSRWRAEFLIQEKQFMDFDNLVAKLKWPFDYLKQRGVIVDDAPKNFWPSVLPTQVAKQKIQRQRLTIFLQEI